MKRSVFLMGITLIVLYSCNQDDIIKLKDNGDEKITYSANDKYGYRMSIFKHIEDQYIQYAVRLNGNGEVMYVYKTRVAKGNDEIVTAGPTWYLVSDTTDTLYGAKFFNGTILGYYGAKESNFIRDNNFKGRSIPYLEEEKAVFVEVAQLMKEKKETFIPFDSTRNLFWFKYNLQ